MNNAQLAAARRAMRDFPDLRPRVEGDTIIPMKKAVPGQAVQVTRDMAPETVARLLQASCSVLADG